MHISKPSCRTRIQGLGGIEDVNMIILFILEENVTTTHYMPASDEDIGLVQVTHLTFIKNLRFVQFRLWMNLFLFFCGGDI